MGNRNSMGDIADLMRSLSRIVTISHYNPDIDAYGSSIGLALALEELGKEVCVVNESGILPKYRFVPGIDRVSATIPSGDWQAILVLDCGDLKRVGDSLMERVSKSSVLVNVDHHASNDYFAKYNFVDEKASSTSQMVYRLLKEMKCRMSRDVATCLLGGIIGDTGSFKYANTSEETFVSAADLVRHGASSHQISEELFGQKSPAAVRLWSYSMSGMQLHFENCLAEMIIHEETFRKAGATHEDVEGLVEEGRDIQGVLVSTLIYKKEDIWRVSLRSRRPDLDVSKIASLFGGGGHKVAAGFRCRKSLEEFRPVLLQEIEKVLKTGGKLS